MSLLAVRSHDITWTEESVKYFNDQTMCAVQTLFCGISYKAIRKSAALLREQILELPTQTLFLLTVLLLLLSCLLLLRSTVSSILVLVDVTLATALDIMSVHVRDSYRVREHTGKIVD